MLVATAPFAQEIQALKTELQATLSRLSAPPSRSQERLPASPWSDATTTTNASINTTPTTVRSDATTERASPSLEADATTRILRELVATARRRRQAETQLVRELERDARVQEDANASHQRAKHESCRQSEDDARERAIRREIDALRLRRKQILRQIDDESKTEDARSRPVQRTMEDDPASNLSGTIRQCDNQEYSIEGVVKLAPVEGLQQPTRTPTPPIVTSEPSSFYAHHHPQFMGFAGHHHSQRHQEVIQDVFSIQLKFAETMLQLEKSIQMRDRLLVPPSSSSSSSTYRRRTAPSRRQAPLRRRSRQPPTVYEDGERNSAEESSSASNDFGQQLENSSAEASMSETTSRLWRRYHPDSQLTPAGTARSTPSTGASTAPESNPSPEDNAKVASTPASLSNQPSVEEHLHTPSTNESAKQVRFNDQGRGDEYPTPLIARNISFDQDSIESTTDDERPTMRRTMRAAFTASYGPVRSKPVLSVLSSDDEAPSFMDGSSVCSADLNDESFLTAFTALRKEVRGRAIQAQQTQSQIQPSPAVGAVVVANDPATSETTELDPTTLKQQKRSLTLDIQELTAKLVLAQDAATRGQVSVSLDRLRRQLRVIESFEAKP